MALGLRPAIAVKLYREETLTLEKAAKVANQSVEAFLEVLARVGVPIADYSSRELVREVLNRAKEKV
ncbi:MAG TPA: UPF0175 family protein [Gammaproteobacteria bacterium]|nr:UPF0175 family protein [Gammaproteobacteria bacterium]